MLIIGLTGQSGVGKGEFSRIFKTFDGVCHLDTDITARKVVEKGKPCLLELCDYFGKEILSQDGTLNRKKLAELAFSDKEKHEKLNSITHFYVMEEIKKWLDVVEKEGAKVAIIDAPLLFESGANALCDLTIGITAPYSTRLKRIIERDSIDEKSAKLRLNSQPDDEFYKEKCTHIISNNTSIDSFKKKAENLIAQIFQYT